MSDITIYECKDGRVRVYIKYTQQVISYPRYLMEKKLGRQLYENEQVHHKDENPMNNNIENLEIKLLGEHQRIHSVKYFDKIAICEWCGKEFLWTAKQQCKFYGNHNNRKGKRYNNSNPFCSKSCASKYGRQIQLNNKQ